MVRSALRYMYLVSKVRAFILVVTATHPMNLDGWSGLSDIYLVYKLVSGR